MPRAHLHYLLKPSEVIGLLRQDHFSLSWLSLLLKGLFTAFGWRGSERLASWVVANISCIYDEDLRRLGFFIKPLGLLRVHLERRG